MVSQMPIREETTPTEWTAQAVHEAAEMLDRIKPQWAGLVNIDELEMMSPTKCILGQVFAPSFGSAAGYTIGGTAIREARETHESGIFASGLFKNDWVREITLRV